MRLPNGFGRITKIRNQKLRKPYRVMVTVGKDHNGRPIGRILKPEGYFKTYNEAYVALVKYHDNPYDLDSMITMNELYNKWSEQHFEKLKSEGTKQNITSTWKKATGIYNMQVREVRTRHLKGCIDRADATITVKKRLKTIFNMMFDYAVMYDLVDKNYARELRLDLTDEHEHHIAFTEEELEILWQNITYPFVDVLLIQCYSGWRPREILNIKTNKINLDQNIIIGGMKTEAGKERIVPIHPAIRDLIVGKYHIDNEYLIEASYDTYRRGLIKIYKEFGLNPDHKPHDGRKTFVTLAKKYNVDEYAIKRIIGHSISDLTEDVYTERSNEWLYNEICKIRP